MLSPADMLVVGVAALLFFGPDQLPKVARRAGQVVRDVQATSASFIREMERAADEPDHRTPYVPPEPYTPDPPTVTTDATSHATAGHEPYAPDQDWRAHDPATIGREPNAPAHHPPTTNEAHASVDYAPATMNGEPHATLDYAPATTNVEPHTTLDYTPATTNGEPHPKPEPNPTQKSGPAEANPPESTPL